MSPPLGNPLHSSPRPVTWGHPAIRHPRRPDEGKALTPSPAFARLGPLCRALLPAAPAAHARPAHKKALADYFGPRLAPRLNDCRTCHLPDTKDEDSDRPHNAFGARLKAVRDELKKAGKKT